MIYNLSMKREEYTATDTRTGTTAQVWAFHQGQAEYKGTLALGTSHITVRKGK